MSARAIATLQTADWIYAEDTRHTRPLLTHFAIATDRLRSLHEHNEATAAQQIIELVHSGATVAYVSDAGMPGVSDPGERLVRACADAGVVVECVPGASAVLAAVVLSGLPTVPFTFYGFIDRKGAQRKELLRSIASSSATSVIFESPRRVGATLRELAVVCGDERRAAIVREITKLHEEVVRDTLGSLAEFSEQDQLTERGEFVIVIGPNVGDDGPADEGLIDDFIAELLRDGVRIRDVADAVAHKFNVAKRDAYDRAVRQSRGT